MDCWADPSFPLSHILSPSSANAMTDSQIGKVIAQFKELRKPELRYASFDYCFNYFRAFKETGRLQELATNENLEKSCLQLGFFLASWGMYRMSGELAKKTSMKHFVKVIEEVSEWDSNHELGAIWDVDANKYHSDNAIECLENSYAKIRELALPRSQTKAETLVTKIMLGIFGCVPAFDGLFTTTFGNLYRAYGCCFTKFNSDALEKLGDFYIDHQDIIDKLAKETKTLDFRTGKNTRTSYTKAKIIDMVGFQYERNVRTKGKGEDV